MLVGKLCKIWDFWESKKALCGPKIFLSLNQVTNDQNMHIASGPAEPVWQVGQHPYHFLEDLLQAAPPILRDTNYLPFKIFGASAGPVHSNESQLKFLDYKLRIQKFPPDRKFSKKNKMCSTFIR